MIHMVWNAVAFTIVTWKFRYHQNIYSQTCNARKDQLAHTSVPTMSHPFHIDAYHTQNEALFRWQESNFVILKSFRPFLFHACFYPLLIKLIWLIPGLTHLTTTFMQKNLGLTNHRRRCHWLTISALHLSNIRVCCGLTPLHSEWPKHCRVLAILSKMELTSERVIYHITVHIIKIHVCYLS